MKKKTDTVSKIESKIYKITDGLKMTADERADIENLVDDLAMVALDVKI